MLGWPESKSILLFKNALDLLHGLERLLNIPRILPSLFFPKRDLVGAF